eukprot:GHRQ01009731.1.p3 GENE.GHRQ01009731.1~~GHRQ01009731.1.p3  ORF type:complete len:100 (+),score=55.88 GHRQ01009731.1:54-353(+)
MAVMETVVSTTMSHPNIVQVYTYVLQPLMSGQDGITSGNSKGQDPSCQDQQQQQAPVQQQQQQQQARASQQQQLSCSRRGPHPMQAVSRVTQAATRWGS